MVKIRGKKDENYFPFFSTSQGVSGLLEDEKDKKDTFYSFQFILGLELYQIN